MMFDLSFKPVLRYGARPAADSKHTMRRSALTQNNVASTSRPIKCLEDCVESPSASRPAWALMACAISCSVTMSLAPPCLANPYLESKKTIILGVTSEGTIRGCLGNVNPNCVSTASTNELYAPAWRAKTRTAREAAQEMESTVLALYPEWSLAQSQTYDFGEYRAFLVPSLFGKDILEFLIKDESVNNRNWEGDREGPYVTYRSLAGSVKYIWPIQQPLSDFGAQKARLQELREKLGWQVIGCELIECYDY
ncbi:hypothetical protein Vretimale_5857 [Volvox reticuliferus]|uniref:Uncharacterized protein n=2 Tax=Volvox reticuliferus TaxID=1737510 RepID=A0A8J4G6J9_9CHLO|nr:hypothetical protein Vretifemale_5882 [Volvox reticuliferus]GIM00982.1 hypothetical protein Vretimale_5857 [Volvox reticuliferus]